MKRIFAVLLIINTIFSLAGCTNSAKQKDAYQLGEHLFSDCTIEQIVEKLGPYQKSYRDYPPNREVCSITLYYDHLKISLEHPALLYSESYAPKDGEDGTLFTQVTFTESDKKIPMKVEYIMWTDRTDLSGPRNIKIGDSLESVKAKFYDLSDKYDGKTIYRLKDIHPDGLKIKSDKYDSVVEKIPKGSEIAADEALHYYAISDLDEDNDPSYYESVSFYFKDNKLIMISERRGTDKT